MDKELLNRYDEISENFNAVKQEICFAVLDKVKRIGKTKVSKELGYDQSYLSNMLRRKNTNRFWRELYEKLLEIEEKYEIS